MSHCPSQDWDTYCRNQELPETCVCGAENSTEDGEWVCKEYPGYCCEQCYTTHQLELKASDEAEAEYYASLHDQ